MSIHGTEYYVKIMVQGSVKRMELYRLLSGQHDDDRRMEDRLRHCYVYVPAWKEWLYVVNVEVYHDTMATTWVMLGNEKQLNDVMEWMNCYS